MALNDGFLDMMPCPHCGDLVARRLQIKMDGVQMRDYRPGAPVSPELLDSIRQSEAEFINTVEQNLKASVVRVSGLDLESAEGTLVVVGSAYRIGPACKCGRAPEDLPCGAAVNKGIYEGLVTELPDRGPLVTDRGAVFPRRMLQNDELRPMIVGVLKDFLGDCGGHHKNARNGPSEDEIV